MAMVAIYHSAASIGYACASTISTMRYALMDHCVQGVTLQLYRNMACFSYAHFIHLRARELQPYVHLYKAITEHIYKAQQHRLMPSRVRRGHRNQFWALGAMANCECVEGWGRVLEHLDTCGHQ